MKKSRVAAFLLAVLWVGLWIGVSRAGLQAPLTKGLQVDLFASLEPHDSQDALPGNLSSGLVLEYTMDSITGTTITDTSGNGKDGTISNAIVSGSGMIGNALSFDGTGDYVTIPALNLGSNFSTSVWINRTELRSYPRIINATTDYKFTHFLKSPGREACTIGGNGSTWGTAVNGAVISASTWHHIVVVYNAGAVTCYVDNSPLSGTTTSATLNSQSFYLGKDVSGSTDYDYSGLMDQVRFWNRSLTADEVSLLYNGGSGI